MKFSTSGHVLFTGQGIYKISNISVKTCSIYLKLYAERFQGVVP